MKNHQTTLTGLVVAAVTLAASHAAGAEFLVNERNASSIWRWNNSGAASVYHQTRANDADLNVAEGSTMGWFAEHNNDHFGRFVPGSGTGFDQQYSTPYAYPKHVTVFNGEVVVMSRNDGTLQRYDLNGNSIGSTATGVATGQGMATDGRSLFASVWGGSSSSFIQYDAGFNQIGTFANPTGMGGNTNIVDLAWDGATGHFFGLATNFEQGTLTETNTVLEFTMGGAVHNSYTLGFSADGIGQYNPVPEPITLVSCATGFALLLRRRRKGA